MQQREQNLPRVERRLVVVFYLAICVYLPLHTERCKSGPPVPPVVLFPLSLAGSRSTESDVVHHGEAGQKAQVKVFGCQSTARRSRRYDGGWVVSPRDSCHKHQQRVCYPWDRGKMLLYFAMFHVLCNLLLHNMLVAGQDSRGGAGG